MCIRDRSFPVENKFYCKLHHPYACGNCLNPVRGPYMQIGEQKYHGSCVFCVECSESVGKGGNILSTEDGFLHDKCQQEYIKRKTAEIVAAGGKAPAASSLIAAKPQAVSTLQPMAHKGMGAANTLKNLIDEYGSFDDDKSTNASVKSSSSKGSTGGMRPLGLKPQAAAASGGAAWTCPNCPTVKNFGGAVCQKCGKPKPKATTTATQPKSTVVAPAKSPSIAPKSTSTAAKKKQKSQFRQHRLKYTRNVLHHVPTYILARWIIVDVCP
eukprot:TRINITY_DN1116_c0_g1_i10.p1 TRINITY_DN1116_c0_g1~~TRINITY_DN1116_c0_g1_i10.p1  ORF type:complete len:269 (+),score=29.93 TRINITY_DN1116_c0_g1_i10:66-872(+)